MNNRLIQKGFVDENGRIILPGEILAEYGLKPGVEFFIESADNRLKLHPPADILKKVYIEPTTRCNLGCKTCIRNVWDEPQGNMTHETFSKTIEGLERFSPAPSIFFGGLGEPLAHPDIVSMVADAKNRGAYVELICNGTLLSTEMSEKLIGAGLDMLWISLDGATPESYADVRLGAELPKVIRNVTDFHRLRLKKNITGCCAEPGGHRIFEKPYIGIVFVAMKRNIKDLPAILSIASNLAASRVLVSNLLPYTKEMAGEVLYSNTMYKIPSVARVEMPLIIPDESTKEAQYGVARSSYALRVNDTDLSQSRDRCPFIEKNATAVSWNGDVSPCLPLLHSYNCFVNGEAHYRKRHAFGNVLRQSLDKIWHTTEYASFRERLKTFDFSPCSECGGCDLSENNETDCFGNITPTYGNCLWAQGLIRCP